VILIGRISKKRSTNRCSTGDQGGKIIRGSVNSGFEKRSSVDSS
jgi:hypothetical protein